MWPKTALWVVKQHQTTRDQRAPSGACSGHSGPQPLRCPAEQCDLPYAGGVEEAHHDATKPNPHTSVGRAAKTKEIKIVGQTVQLQSSLLCLRNKAVVAMLPLRTSRDFKATPEEIETLRNVRATLMAHMIEGPAARRVVSYTRTHAPFVQQYVRRGCAHLQRQGRPVASACDRAG